MSDEKRTPYDVITDRIVSMLESGTVPWRRPWGSAGFVTPKSLHTGRPYQGVNVFLLATAGYRSPFWLTFNQARERGGSVCKGEKGFSVFFWKVYDVKANADAGPSSEDSEKRSRFVAKYYTVFNTEQCEGLDIEPPPELTPVKPFEAVQAADVIRKRYLRGGDDNHGTNPEGPTLSHGGNSAHYTPIADAIKMPESHTFHSSEEYYSTLFHEMTHSTGHEKRLGRFDNTRPPAPFGSGDYGREELIAEMGSAFLCAEAGIDTHVIGNQAAYIAGWLKTIRSDKKAVVYAAASARKAVEYIRGKDAV